MTRQKKEIAKKPKPPKKKVIKAKAKILGGQVKMLAQYGMNNTEIAEYYGVNESTIRRGYAEFLTKGRAEQKLKLRRKQFQVAMKGNIIMLIWLGKQMLGQADKVENKSESKLIIERSLMTFEDEEKEGEA